MRLRRLSVVFGPLAWALVACGDPTPTESTPDAAPAPAAAQPEVAAEVVPPEAPTSLRVDITRAAPPSVTVDRPGAAPKEPLRFTPKVGATDSVLMTMNMGVRMAGKRLPAPPIIVDSVVRVDELTDEQIKLTYTVRGMKVGDPKRVEAAMVATLGSMFADLEPFDAHLELDRRGVLQGGYVEVPQSLPAPMRQIVEEIQQSMAQLQVPLPQDAVGVGAKWTVVGAIVQGGMELEQTATYQLLQRDGPKLKLKVKVSQKLVKPTFTPPGMPGVKAKVTMFQSGGTGRVELSTDHPAPTSMMLAIKLKMAMDVALLGQSQSQDLQLDMKLELMRQEPPATVARAAG